VVERLLPKQDIVGPNPITRSKRKAREHPAEPAEITGRFFVFAFILEIVTESSPQNPT
jgi:hypothetical protein